MNRVAEKLTGWTLPEAKGKTFSDVFNIINEENWRKVHRSFD
jgi:PAS domain-containing protein